MVYSELLVLLSTLTNQSLHRLVLVESHSVETPSIRSYPIGMVLAEQPSLAATVMQCRHILLLLVVCSLLAEQQRKSRSTTICPLQMYSALKTSDFFLNLQLQQKTSVLFSTETPKHTTTELFSTETKQTLRLVQHSCLVLQLQLVSENHPTTQLDLCLLLVELPKAKQQTNQNLQFCSAFLDPQFTICLSATFLQVLCLELVEQQRESPSVTTNLPLYHSAQKISVLFLLQQQLQKITVNYPTLLQTTTVAERSFSIKQLAFHSDRLRSLQQQNTFINLTSYRLVLVASILLVTRQIRSCPTGTDLDQSVFLVATVMRCRLILSSLVVYSPMVSLAKQSPNITTSPPSMSTVLLITDLFLQLLDRQMIMV